MAKELPVHFKYLLRAIITNTYVATEQQKIPLK